jgi:hypothetical protein
LNTLTSVDALSSTSAWAVGSYLTPHYPGTDAVRKTLIERWNGTSWSVVKSPNPATLGNSLLGVAATGPNDFWAVGWKISDKGLRSLILHYDGTAWTEAAVPPSAPGRTCSPASRPSAPMTSGPRAITTTVLNRRRLPCTMTAAAGAACRASAAGTGLASSWILAPPRQVTHGRWLRVLGLPEALCHVNIALEWVNLERCPGCHLRQGRV